MPIISKPYWLAKCDGCGREADESDYGEFSAFSDAGGGRGRGSLGGVD